MSRDAITALFNALLPTEPKKAEEVQVSPQLPDFEFPGFPVVSHSDNTVANGPANIHDFGRAKPSGRVLARLILVKVDFLSDLEIQVLCGHGGTSVHGPS